MGKDWSTFFSLMDSTSHKNGEPRDIEDELRHLLINSVTDYAIFSLDANGHVISWNPGAQKLKSYSADEIIGQHFSRFYSEEDKALALPAQALAVAVSAGRFENEGWRVRKDGSKFWAWVVITPMYDSTGTLKGFAKVTKDLTERKRAEDNRLRMAHLQEAARVRDEFLAYISHEMRGPLTSIQLQLRLLRQEREKITQQRIDTICSRLDRSYALLAELVNSVLQQSRIQAGRALIQRAPVDLAKAIREVVEELRPEAESKGLRFSVCDDIEQKVISTDAAALRVILLNLINNAVKFSSRGIIDVRLSATAAEYRISVHDEGPGIPVEDQERIFEPFERVESLTHKHVPGFGLGLATSKKLSEALGGRIELSSRSGSGSIFTLVLLPEGVS
jgi:PAS domain S-box-containing protein